MLYFLVGGEVDLLSEFDGVTPMRRIGPASEIVLGSGETAETLIGNYSSTADQLLIYQLLIDYESQARRRRRW